jgi:hypothetical protein
MSFSFDEILEYFKNEKIINYGSYENPLFKAKDIGDLLGIDQIRKTLESLDTKFKIKKKALTKSGEQNQWFLTIDGIKYVLSISRKPKSINLCKLFNIEYNIKIVAKETQFIYQIKTAFKNYNMKEQFSCLNYRIDLYFTDYNLAIEFDENHSYKNSINDKIRQNEIEEYLQTKILRVKYNDNIFEIINIIIGKIIKPPFLS